MKLQKLSLALFFIISLFISTAYAGPYAPAAGEPGSTAIHMDDVSFVAWATGYENYTPGTDVDETWKTPEKALGKALGSSYDIVCLGRGGSITMTFAKPIINGEGADFAVFENSFSDDFIEHAYVEVSADGGTWYRFPNSSLTTDPVSGYGTVDPTNVYQLGCKYKQGYGEPYDLASVGLDEISYVRILDIIGDGTYYDTDDKVIYDPYPTWGSAGFDLDAVGVIHQKTVAVTAVFSVAPATGTAPLTVQFSDASTGDIDTWNWNFGDGETSTEQNPTYIYQNPGDYDVTLQVSGSEGNDSTTIVKAVRVQGEPPTAAFNFSPDNGSVPLTVQFTDTSSGNIISWVWDFGDGSDNSIEQNPEHIYQNPGTYSVIFYVDGLYGGDQVTKTDCITTTAAPIPNNPPDQPTLVSPVDGANDLSLPVTLSTGAFSDPDSGDSHAQTRWQVSTSSGFTSFVYNSKAMFKLTSMILSDSILANGTTYYWRVMFYDNEGAGSAWSATRSFTTVQQQINYYFPHIVSNGTWETEIALINASAGQQMTGELIACNDAGEEVDRRSITLAANARRKITIGEEFSSVGQIGYLVFQTYSTMVRGYTKFYVVGVYRVAVPVVSQVNSGDIYVSHIASDDDWWTGLSLVNTTSSTKELTVLFDNGESKVITLDAGMHRAVTISELFEGEPQPEILSAVITNADGIVGLEVFGSKGQNVSYLSGVLLKDETTTGIYFPHIAFDDDWWTGLVAYNPFAESCTLNITPYRADGTALASPAAIQLAGHGKYLGAVSSLNLPTGTAWLQITASHPVTGFESFGTINNQQMAGYTGVGIAGTESVFVNLEKEGWTGIAFVNLENSPAAITLSAYAEDGSVVAITPISLAAHAKVVDLPANLFSGQDIGSATYIRFSSDKQVVGFQLNGSFDNMMLDALPGM